MRFFSDIVFIAAMVRAIYEILSAGYITFTIYLVVTMGLPFFLGAVSRADSERLLYLSPRLVVTVIREGFALATLAIFVVLLGKQFASVFLFATAGSVFMYLFGRLFRFTAKLIWATLGLALVIVLASVKS